MSILLENRAAGNRVKVPRPVLRPHAHSLVPALVVMPLKIKGFKHYKQAVNKQFHCSQQLHHKEYHTDRAAASLQLRVKHCL